MENTQDNLNTLMNKVQSTLEILDKTLNKLEKLAPVEGMWTAERVGQELGGKSPQHVKNLYKNHQYTQFPLPIHYTSFDGGVERVSQPLWHPSAVQVWLQSRPKLDPSCLPRKKRTRCSNVKASEHPDAP